MKTIVNDLWSVIFPVVQLLIVTAGPLLVAWLAARISSVLKINGDAARAEFEKNLRDALHQSAVNALKLVTAKLMTGGGSSVPLAQSIDINRDLLIEYVMKRNPEAVEYFNLNPKGIMDIIQSKIPDLFSAGPPAQ